jgi:tRNA nucleotidyltransferase (CCA-adding enzyme)
MKKVLSEVLREITPSKDDIENGHAIFEKIREEVFKKYQKKAIMVGSVAKDTHIKGQRDLDIFVLFPESMPLKELETEGLKIAKDVLKGSGYEEHWAQHPYLVSEIGGFKVEIVPCYAVKSPEKIKSAVDRTPFHKEYVLAKLDSKKRGDVRLLKAFLKGAGIYGAEERYQGFSGYLCELLIIHAGSFEALLREAAQWPREVFIDIEKISSKSQMKKFGTDFVVIDPVDRNRNVASAVSERSLAVFMEHARAFLHSPSASFFTPKKGKGAISEKIKERGTHLLLVKFETPKVIEEILYSQLRKSLHSIIKALESSEFRIYDSDFFEEGGHSYFVLETLEHALPPVCSRFGPPVFEKVNDEQFLEKHKDKRKWLVGSRWVVECERKYKTPEDVIFEILKKPEAHGIGSYICEPIKKAKILTGEKIKDLPSRFGSYLVKE